MKGLTAMVIALHSFFANIKLVMKLLLDQRACACLKPPSVLCCSCRRIKSHAVGIVNFSVDFIEPLCVLVSSNAKFSIFFFISACSTAKFSIFFVSACSVASSSILVQSRSGFSLSVICLSLPMYTMFIIQNLPPARQFFASSMIFCMSEISSLE